MGTMGRRESVLDRRDSARHKLLSIVMSLVLILSFINLAAITGLATADDENDPTAAEIVDNADLGSGSVSAAPETDATESVEVSNPVVPPTYNDVEDEATSSDYAEIPAQGSQVTAPVVDPEENADKAIAPKAVGIDGVTLTLVNGTAEYSAGDTFDVKANVYPQTANVTRIEWTSNMSVARLVSEDLSSRTATFQAAGEGNTNITAKVYTTDDDPAFDNVNVTVKPIKVSSLKITGYYEDYMSVNTSVALGTAIEPENASEAYRAITWTSSNPEVVSVDEDGYMVAHTPGTAVVRAEAIASGKYDQITVKVYEGAPMSLPVQLITFGVNGNSTEISPASLTIPTTGEEIAVTSFIPSVVADYNSSYVFSGEVKCSNGSVSKRSDFNGMESISMVRVVDGTKLQYTSNGSDWNDFNYTFVYASYDQNQLGDTNSGISMIIGGDTQPPTSTKTKNRTVTVEVYDRSTGTIIDSQTIKFSRPNANATVGPFAFNCDNTKYIIESATVTKNGAQIATYGKDDVNSITVDFTNNSSVDENYVITVVVDVEQITFSYDLNGGYAEGIPSAIQATEGDVIDVTSVVPTRDDYSFAGWEYAGTIYQPGDSVTMPNENVVLVARWNDDSDSITYESNNTSLGIVDRPMDKVAANPSEMYEVTGSTAIPTSGTFAGWYAKSDIASDGYPVSGASCITTDTTLKPANEAGAYVAVFTDNLDASFVSFNGTYDGYAHAATLDYTGQYTAQYSTDGENWSSENPSFTDVSENTVYARIAMDGTDGIRAIVWNGEAQVTINRMPITVKVNDAEKQYGQDLPEFTVDVPSTPNGYVPTYENITCSANTFSSVGEYAIDIAGEADQDNYVVTFEPGVLTIVKASERPGLVQLTVIPYVGTYDGLEHGVTVLGAGLDGDVTYYSESEEGPWSVTPLTAKNVRDSGKSIYVKIENPNYEDVIESGSITIEPATIIVKAMDKIANNTTGGDNGGTEPEEGDEPGVEGTSGEYPYSILQNGQGLETASFTGEPTCDPGDEGVFPITQGTLALANNESTGFDADNYNLQFIVGQYYVVGDSELVVVANDVYAEYDGTEHAISVQTSITGATISYCEVSEDLSSEFEANADYRYDGAFTVGLPPSMVDAGTKYYVIRAEAKAPISNVEDKVFETMAVININQKNYAVHTSSASKVYDGEPLVSEAATVEGIVDPEIVNVKATGSQTEVGSSANTYEIEWVTAKESNYNLWNEDLGVLTVDAVPLPAPGVTPDVLGGAVADTTDGEAAAAGTTGGAVAPILPTSANIADDENPLAAGEQQIADDENPLAGLEQAGSVSTAMIYLLIGLVGVFGILVAYRNRAYAQKVDSYARKVVGK